MLRYPNTLTEVVEGLYAKELVQEFIPLYMHYKQRHKLDSALLFALIDMGYIC